MLNPQMLATLLQGNLTKNGSGADSMGGLGSMLTGGNGNGGVPSLLLLLAGMGIPQLPKIMNTMMDWQSMGKEDSQQQPGALPTPTEGGPAAAGPSPGTPPQGMPPQGMPPQGMPPPAPGGVPPQMIPILMQLAAMRRGMPPAQPMPM